jgi:hypothetical protein
MLEESIDLAVTEALMRAAAEAHPNWENLPDGSFRWLGGRGARTPNGLLKWFLRSFLHDAQLITARI